MRLFGLLVVQNEADVIDDLLRFLQRLNIYEKIFLYDLGSTDDTFSRALAYQQILHEPQVLNQPYTEKLRYDLLAARYSLFQNGDWMAIIDADEFYVDNPLDAIREAERESATCIRTYQIQFQFTDLDARTVDADTNTPIYERQKHYLISWSEARFYKFIPERFIDSDKPSSRRLLNRHYQYRSPRQIESRVKTRLENRRRTRGLRGRQEWSQIYSKNWKDYIVPHHLLHRFDGVTYRFGLPADAQWKDYFGKDPFSHVYPQIAVLFEREREASNSKSTERLFNEEYQPGRITFIDSFSRRVREQMHCDLRHSRFQQAIEGFLVLMRYRARTGRESVSMLRARAKFRIGSLAARMLSLVKRLASFKSAGYLSAHPNPVEVSDISGSGVTVLRWKAWGSQKVELRLDSPDGGILHAGQAAGSYQTERWISDDMVFFLQDVTGGLPATKENTLSTVRVKVSTGGKITI